VTRIDVRVWCPLAMAWIGCAQSASDAFIGDRTIDLCLDVLPACEGTVGCVLDEDEYLEGGFPSTRRFLVDTESAAEITVSILFASRGSAGADTRIRWYEPNCADRDEWASQGIDVFREAGDDRVLSRTGRVSEFGEHLVEIRSDAFADYLVKVDVEFPEGG
jgi:hypothetical protein